MTSLEELRVCSWDTASDCGSAHSRMLAEAQQHGGALIETCQRLEAMNFGPCGHPTCQSRVGESAFAYLCALAAGIESVVLGETEIVGQLRLAGRHASPALENVITRAVAVGRTFRRRHDLAADAGQLFDLGIAATGIKKPRSVLIAGSGPTTRRLAARAAESGSSVTVASRTKPAWGDAAHITWTSLARVPYVSSDVAFVALGGDAPILHAESIRAAAVVDVSTPRRTEHSDPRVVTLVALRERTLADEHELRSSLKTNLRADVQQAIEAWRRDASSPIGRLRQSVEQMRQEELQRLRRRHPEIPEATIEALTRSMVNRMFHQPVVRLKSLEPEIAASVADLFAAPANGGRN